MFFHDYRKLLFVAVLFDATPFEIMVLGMWRRILHSLATVREIG